ncbi:MAG TPA: hypothetical protein VKZ18_22950 [Polyangia bacterium]|nr:hypothetical protein [Polyangia bacterium]
MLLALGRAVTAVALGLVLGTGGAPMHDSATFTVKGEPVTMSFVDDPAIGHGKFRLVNHGAARIVAVVERAWFETSEAAPRELSPLLPYDDDHDRSLDPSRIEVPPGATLNLSIGFPRLAYTPRDGEECAIRLRVKVGAAVREARSPLVLIRRIPLDKP